MDDAERHFDGLMNDIYSRLRGYLKDEEEAAKGSRFARAKMEEGLKEIESLEAQLYDELGRIPLTGEVKRRFAADYEVASLADRPVILNDFRQAMQDHRCLLEARPFRGSINRYYRLMTQDAPQTD